VLALEILLALSPGAAGAPFPTTAADFFQPGTQPSAALDNFQQPASCATFRFCHGNYLDFERPLSAEEPYDGWVTSLMAQSARDPVWQAAAAIANTDTPGAGETCIRCHAPVGWLATRSSGGEIEVLTAGDLEGVTCHFCHRMVSPVLGGGSAAGDGDILRALAAPPSACAEDPAVKCVAADDCGVEGRCLPADGQGRFVIDPADSRRGPIEVGNGPAQVPAGLHAPAHTVFSPFHRTSAQCASCHDVSTATYTRRPDGSYATNDFGAPGPFDPHAMFPEQRTFSEWFHSDFGDEGPCRGGGDAAACVEASCQDCHMPDVLAKASGSAPLARADMPQHAFAGANTWVLQAIRDLCLDGAGAGMGGSVPGCGTLPIDKLTSTCRDDPTIGCTADSACGDAGPCAGACVRALACSGDPECGDGGLCVKNAATAAYCASDPARACTADADCDDLGPCVGECGGDLRCAADIECGAGGGACVKGPATFAHCAGDVLASCTNDGDCGPAGPCLGQCRGSLLPACTTDAACTAGARCIKDPVRIAETRTEQLLRGGGDLVLGQDGELLTVRVVNQAGHKLPTGYPEGRRMWLAVRFLDGDGEVIREHGAYDFTARQLRPPSAGNVLKVYEARHAVDAAVAAATGLAPGTGFHLVLSNSVEKDNRIPPRGFRHAAYETIGAAPKGAAYADGQHWDDTSYRIPTRAAEAQVILYFETTTRGYVEFLRDSDPDGDGGAGARAFAQWSKHARPVVVDARRLMLDPVAGSTTSTTTTTTTTSTSTSAITSSTMTTTSTTPTTIPNTPSSTSTTSTSMPRCVDDRFCDDENPCTADPGIGCLYDNHEGPCDDDDGCTHDDHCEARLCVERVTDVAGVACRLGRLTEAPCGAEALPRKLDKRIRKQVHKALSLLETAVKLAGKGRQEKAEKLRGRAAKQLDAISHQGAKAVEALKAGRRGISDTCKGAIDGIVSTSRLVVEGFGL